MLATTEEIRWDREIALPYAEELCRELSAVARNDNCLIVGSLRRETPTVKDIEILIEPIYHEQLDFFDMSQPANITTPELDKVLNVMLDEGFLRRRDKQGQRYRNYTVDGRFKLDLFIVLPPAQWGVLATIRTGPADFSRRLVTPRQKNGLLPSYLKQKDGALWNGSELIPTPTEQSYFNALDLDWIEPKERV